MPEIGRTTGGFFEGESRGDLKSRTLQGVNARSDFNGGQGSSGLKKRARKKFGGSWSNDREAVELLGETGSVRVAEEECVGGGFHRIAEFDPIRLGEVGLVLA